MSSCNTCQSKDSCGQASTGGCDSSGEAEVLQQLPQATTKVKAIIGICSGKGGVGKSMVTSVLASKLAREGFKVGILDADVTGPSIPKAFGINNLLKGNESGIKPAVAHSGIKIVSVNLIMENQEAPVLWRGPVISGVVKQFWTDVLWEELDCLLIDMPPGTGDVPLTVFQSIPLDGILLVSTPQDLVSMIVNKARNMALMMQVKILGFVENMSYTTCPHCNEKHSIFGEGGVEKAAAELNVPVLDKVGIDPKITQLIDQGNIEKTTTQALDNTMNYIIQFIEQK